MSRTLKDVAYYEAVPTFGRCSQCNKMFTPSLRAATDEDRARTFYHAFEQHKCEEDEANRPLE